MGATHQPIGQTAAACDWPEPMNADRQCRQTPNLASAPRPAPRLTGLAGENSGTVSYTL